MILRTKVNRVHYNTEFEKNDTPWFDDYCVEEIEFSRSVPFLESLKISLSVIGTYLFIIAGILGSAISTFYLILKTNNPWYLLIMFGIPIVLLIGSSLIKSYKNYIENVKDDLFKYNISEIKRLNNIDFENYKKLRKEYENKILKESIEEALIYKDSDHIIKCLRDINRILR